MLSEHVGESMNRVENTVNRVADDVRALQGQVSEIRIEQTAQKGQLSDLTKDHDQREADKKERSKELRGLIFKVLGVGAALVAASVAGAYGKTWLAAFFRALAGG